MSYPTDRSDNIRTDTLDHALEILAKLEAAIGPDVLDVLSLMYVACHQYYRHQFASAHLISWAVVELLQNELWTHLQRQIDLSAGGHTQMSKDRRKLLSGRDYTASVVSQVLSICGKIDDGTLSQLDESRRRRNDFAHKLAPIEADDAGKTLRLATDLMTKLAGVSITSQLSTSYWL